MQNSDEGWLKQLYCGTVSGHLFVHKKLPEILSAVDALEVRNSLSKLHAEFGLILPVTRLAFPRRRLVEKHCLPIHFARNFVTFVTTDVPVSSLQRKWSAFVVIKLRWLPARRVMTTGAIGSVFASSELSGVGIGVTSGTVFRRGPEIDILQACLQCRGTVAIGAGYAAMRAKESEFCFRMIKPAKFVPSYGRMASFASRHRSVRTLRFHAFAELPVMRIHVTTGTGTILKPVFHRRWRLRGDRFVAICA